MSNQNKTKLLLKFIKVMNLPVGRKTAYHVSSMQLVQDSYQYCYFSYIESDMKLLTTGNKFELLFIILTCRAG